MALVRSVSRTGWLASFAGLLLVAAACGDDETDDDAESGDVDTEASVALVEPETGDEVSSPVELEMDAEGVTIEEAGTVSSDAGHFHVMVDVGCVAPGEVIPDDESHNHFGDGSTTAELDLEPGEHEICLQLGDGAHTALDATDEITVTVTVTG